MRQLSIRRTTALGLVFVVMVIAVSLVIANYSSKKAVVNTGKPAVSQKFDEQIASISKAKLYKVGESVPFASEKAVLNSVKSDTVLSTPYSSPVFADAGTKFVVVNMTLTNTTPSPFVYNSFSLVDQKNRSYDSYQNSPMAVEDYLTGQTLSPYVPKTGEEVYQVPNDATSFRLGGQVGNTGTFKFIQFSL